LREAQPLRRAGEVPLPRDFEEVGELVEFHRKILLVLVVVLVVVVALGRLESAARKSESGVQVSLFPIVNFRK
jgi:hypothetical protein